MAGNSNSGRKRKPTSSLKLFGVYRADRHAARDDERLAVGSPHKPVGMSADAKHVFDLVTKTMPPDVLSQLDGPLLAGTAEWFALYWSMHRAMQKAKMADSDSLAMASQAWKNFLSGATHFGMSPTSRAKFERAGKEAGDDLESFMTQAQ